jgi:hypothetical protein
MRVVEKPGKIIRIRVDAMADGKNLPGCQTIHLTDTTIEEVYNKIASALNMVPLPPLQGEEKR